MSWTNERITLLKKLWGEGRTAAEIANKLGGVTRNAVIGKAHRLKLSNRTSPIQQSNAKKPVKQAESKPAVKVKAVVVKSTFKIKGIKFIDLKERMCRWPSGDPRDADFIFCGHTSVPGLPYCPEHSKAAYQAARTRLLKADDVDNGGGFVADEPDVKEAVG